MALEDRLDVDRPVPKVTAHSSLPTSVVDELRGHNAYLRVSL